MPTSLQDDDVNLIYFKVRFFLSNKIYSLKYQRSTTLGSKDIGIRKPEFVAKTQFLSHDLNPNFSSRIQKL